MHLKLCWAFKRSNSVLSRGTSMKVFLTDQVELKIYVTRVRPYIPYLALALYRIGIPWSIRRTCIMEV